MRTLRHYGPTMVALWAFSSLSARAADDITVAAKKKTAANVTLEEKDRTVDQVALSMQDNAVARLQALLKKYRKTDQEPNLLARLAEAWQQEAAIRFRIAHGRAHKKDSVLDLSSFNASMKSSIATLDQLINGFPSDPDLHEAYYLRAKAYDEISDKANSQRDYLHLVTAYPQSSYTTSAHMRLAEYAIEDNLHDVAVQHLEAVEKKPDDPQYPFALYKLAWSHYNLGHVKTGLGYLERHIAFYTGEEKSETSDTAMRENSLMDLALFYYEGAEKKNPDYPVMGALAYFRRIEKGPLMGKMMARYARLLRAGGFESELQEFKNQALASEIKRPETLDVVMTIFEDRVTKRQYAKLGETSNDLVHVYRDAPNVRTSDAFDKARATLLETAETLQKLVIKNKAANEVGGLAASLSDLYLSFAKVVESTDPRVPRVHFNLAEAYFQIGNFEKATEHYRWSVENWKDPKFFDTAPSALRAIATRYEVLRKRGVIPTSLEAKLIANGGKAGVDPQLTEWISWIDAYYTNRPAITAAGEREFLNYNFEANRALYAAGDTERANARFLSAAEKVPDSEFAIPSASLVLDTAILNQQWLRANELCQELRKVKGWDGTAFGTRVEKLEIDSFYKIAELKLNAKDYQAASQLSHDCLKRYPASDRAADCRLLSARASLALNKEGDASEQLNKLIESAPGSGAAEAALISRAKIEESHDNFLGASKDYRAYMEKGASSDAGLKERTLLLTWLSGDALALAELLSKKSVCQDNVTPTLKLTCDRLTAVMWTVDPEMIQRSTLAPKPAEYLSWSKVVESPRENQALWALAALRWNTDLAFRDRLKVLEILADNWDRVDAIAQFEVLPKLSDTLRLSLESSRRWIATESTLKPEKNSIKKRLARIQELEATATKLVKLPWVRVRAEVLNETAESYMDLSAALRAIPAPKSLPGSELESYSQTLAQLAIPFEEKAQDIRGKAYELALTRKIELESYTRIATVYFRDNPSQSKKYKSAEDDLKMLPALGEASLRAFDPEGAWPSYKAEKAVALSSDRAERARSLKWLWWKSIDQRVYQQTAWYLKEARDGKILDDNALNLMKALALNAVGARAEALSLMEDVKSAAAPVVAVAQEQVTAKKSKRSGQ